MSLEWGALRAATSANRSKSFLKWFGGKTRLLQDISRYIPDYKGRYFEPFLGGGSLLFYLNPRESVISDINKALVITYTVVRDRCAELVDALSSFPKTSQEVYNDKVNEFNRLLPKVYTNQQLTSVESLQLATLFIWINHTCYNGKYNINSQYKFVTTYNKVDGHVVYNPDTDNLNIKSCSKILKHSSIYNRHFRDTIDMSTSGDFVYVDPPYMPFKQNRKYLDRSTYNMYTSEGFVLSDHVELCNIIKRKHDSGVKFIISGNDTPKLRELYSEYEMHSVKVSRNVSADINYREEVNELLIVLR